MLQHVDRVNGGAVGHPWEMSTGDFIVEPGGTLDPMRMHFDCERPFTSEIFPPVWPQFRYQ